MKKYYDLDTPMQRMLATLQETGKEEELYTALEEEQATIHVYPVAGGGILFSHVPLDQEEPTIIESQEPDTEIPLRRHATTPGKEPPFFLFFLLILGFFLLFDMADSQITALLTPIITVTLIPKAHTITTTATLPLVSGESSNGVPGRVLPELTLTQLASTTTTGHGHQDAKQATGRLTLYNGLFTSQFVPIGTVFTGGDGVQVVMSESVTIPSGTPPSYGQATVSAYALKAGWGGNIQAGDINTTIANGILVKNSPFAGGQNSRDYPIVTQADIQRVVSTLIPNLAQDEHAVLTSQLTAGEAFANPTCISKASANHAVGSEATTVQVSVSETCLAVAYNQQAVQVQASRLLTSIAATHLGTGYHLTGSMQVTVKQATATQTPVVVSLSLLGTWVYTFSPQEQQRIKMLIANKTKPQALQMLLSQQGIASVTIAGIAENQPLPEDPQSIRVLVIGG